MKKQYHGTKISNLDYLDVNMCSESSPFGRAIYLTEDPEVADCYTGKSGWIYEVTIDGDWEMVINFDIPFETQTPKVKDLIKKIANKHHVDIKHIPNIRYVLHRNYLEREKTNDFLRSQGVWMIFGKLEAMELSGKMDRGVQYAVLDNKNVSITHAAPFIESKGKFKLNTGRTEIVPSSL